MSQPVPPKPSGRKKSPFYWWRRFPTKQELHPYQPLVERIRNGDFDYPEFFQQARWEEVWCEQEVESIRFSYRDYESYIQEVSDIRARYAKRVRNLNKDGIETETKRLAKITKEFSSMFRISRDEVFERMSNFDGTLEELYWEFHKETDYKRYSMEEIELLVNEMVRKVNQKRGRGRPRKNPIV
jgi:hypothetical protein